VLAARPARMWRSFDHRHGFLAAEGALRGKLTPPSHLLKDQAMTEEEKVKAMRLARAIASDISLYNEQKIIKGIEQDNLFETLKDELDEGRELYKSRVSKEIFTTRNFFERAVNDIVLRSKAHVKSRIW